MPKTTRNVKYYCQKCCFYGVFALNMTLRIQEKTAKTSCAKFWLYIVFCSFFHKM